MSEELDNVGAEEEVADAGELAAEEVADSTGEVDPAGEENATDDSETPAKPKRKKGKKLLIVLIVVVVVLAGGITGGLIWHEQPSFCNAICHNPMDPYLDSFNNNISVWTGLDPGSPLGVTLHKESSQKLECLDCHVPTISEQMSEAMKWITGDYFFPPLDPLEYDETFCLREGCHEGITTSEDLAKATSDRVRNPHDNHNTPMKCYTCHQMHKQSTVWCTSCHAETKVDGWLTWKEFTDSKKAAFGS
jgi:hypothetical protein